MVDVSQLQHLLQIGLQAACQPTGQMLGVALEVRELAPVALTSQSWEKHLRTRSKGAPISAAVAFSGIGTGQMVLGFATDMWEPMQQFFAHSLGQATLSEEALHSGVAELINIIACTCAMRIGERIDGLVRPDVPEVLAQSLVQVVLRYQKELNVPTIVYGTLAVVGAPQRWLDVYWLLEASAAQAVYTRLLRYRNGS